MRPFRVVLRIGRLMIAIAIVALALGPIASEQRQRRASEFFASIARYHESCTVAAYACSRTTRCIITNRSGCVMTNAEVNASERHRRLAEKYWNLAANPQVRWEPDPPTR